MFLSLSNLLQYQDRAKWLLDTKHQNAFCLIIVKLHLNTRLICSDGFREFTCKYGFWNLKTDVCGTVVCPRQTQKSAYRVQVKKSYEEKKTQKKKKRNYPKTTERVFSSECVNYIFCEYVYKVFFFSFSARPPISDNVRRAAESVESSRNTSQSKLDS